MSPELNAALSLCRNLPSPPAIAVRLIELAQDPETDIATAADVIALDMGLSARMMRIANSPLYASRRRIENLGQALTMLGLNATLQLALGFSLSRALEDDARNAQLHEAVWRRGILSALGARYLGLAIGVRRLEELMLAGLLQDIGILALLQVRADSYPAILADATSNDSLLDHERALFDCTHADIGSRLVEMWGLPHYLTHAIAHSEPPAEPADPFERCVALSGALAEMWLADDVDAARAHALNLVHTQLGLDSAQFEQVLQQMSQMLPEISALFDIPVPSPARITYLLDHASELMALRNLRELQDASASHRRADDFEAQARRLSEQAHLDALTGVLNRRQLEVVLEQEFTRASAAARPLSVAFIDLDDFKKINDQHGHLVGDQVLQAFASRLQGQLRGTDTVARFGGEEFVVLFPGANEQIAVEVIRRVLQVITQTPMAIVNEAPLYVTFSAGVATHGAYERFSDTRGLLQAADDVLYRSKNLGRNRVIARAPSPVSQPSAC
ncbi:MAG: HDOD domain-containing protein [Stenotrophomonas sp.]|jgi:diguanylate cyclase (GGDEF)-like protein|uniref:GGDEF domain-containing protein n=1 Tax=unclassified Stenotrophomonas TaxID=196198 RepID=UPI00177DEC83|nr:MULTISPECIES: GGDEF domain-containing protein [unclassified Stenotrophomonas]MBD9537038.1 GGDEF domain-containing protein [Stenotrophomonas sp. STM01]